VGFQTKLNKTNTMVFQNCTFFLYKGGNTYR